MTIPTTLQTVITDSLLQVRQRQTYQPAPEYLFTICAYFGRLQTGSGLFDSIQRRRMLLTLFTIRSIIPRSSAACATDAMPSQFLREMTRLVMGLRASNTLPLLQEQYEDWVIQTFSDTDETTIPARVELCIRMALDAIVAVITGETIDQRSAEQQATVAIIAASYVYAHGHPIEASFQFDRGFTFWETWLHQTVPAAWDVWQQCP